jgi:hypothetical protein
MRFHSSAEIMIAVVRPYFVIRWGPIVVASLSIWQNPNLASATVHVFFLKASTPTTSQDTGHHSKIFRL